VRSTDVCGMGSGAADAKALPLISTTTAKIVPNNVLRKINPSLVEL
jgi:hypothetical protein